MIVASTPIGKNTVVCNYDCLLLEPIEAKAFEKEADAHWDDPEKGKLEYCYFFEHDGKPDGKSKGKWLINANNDPQDVGLLLSFGRLITHSSRHPNLVWWMVIQSCF